MNNKPLQRSRQDRMIAGVLAGLAGWLGWDVTALRIAFVVISLLSSVFPGILVYVVLWILMPEEQ
ncbi:TPA: stress-responsive transcriptional regulator [Candidatus Marinimicrobia bacterium]|nr:MAG: Putative stress-responsive transcriptional regulator [Marinimicrobia bacterium 46_47]KUK93038.1 MAG: Putative stress-responsive transcriptional regulator [Marinimicrobia bacterium 46_43]HAE88078.1 stress-responsive transcriptional regulator [Candidatus Neomarinimicrobiota bacterium]HBY18952.1 stress-responsive transcriptional regulator [Candidatus Neomarinimicrobiota bacterium]